MEGKPPPFQACLNFCSTFRDQKSSDVAPDIYIIGITFVIGKMTASDFKDEWCPFRHNSLAHSSAEMVSANPGTAPTYQTSRIRIIATGFTTLVMTRKLGSTMTILINMF